MREKMIGSGPGGFSCEACLLAGGRSLRMGRDKTRLRLGGVSLLDRVESSARNLGLPTRVIRRDLVPRCGPLGGILTALTTSAADAVLFLSCDMPFVSTALLEKLLERSREGRKPVFVEQNCLKGFPCLLRRKDLSLVSQQISRRQFSLQKLAKASDARVLRLARVQQWELLNINTPHEWREARELWRHLNA